MAKLSEAELAERAGIARETVARLERLLRRAQPETVEALGVSVQNLTTATEELPAKLRPAHKTQPSEQAQIPVRGEASRREFDTVALNGIELTRPG